MDILIRLTIILFAFFTIPYPKQDGYMITGDLTGFPDSTKLYLKNLSNEEIFDSTIVIDGKFQLSGKFQYEPEHIWLTSSIGDKFIYTDLLIGNEKIKIEGDRKDFAWNVKVSGSKTQDEVNHLRDLVYPFVLRRDSLEQNYCKLPLQVQLKNGEKIWEEIRNIDEIADSLNIGYVKSHINTYNGVINLGYLKHSLPKDTVRALYAKLSDELKACKYAKPIEIFLNYEISKIGDDYYDFEALDKTGETVHFSDLIGKYTLLDFTDAYCNPYDQSVDELKYIDKNCNDSLIIVSFYTDVKKDYWLDALKRDRVTWTSLWDGKGYNSETYIKDGIQGSPSFFLINPKGVIIDKWSGYGKGL